jgi:hypothetical protein
MIEVLVVPSSPLAPVSVYAPLSGAAGVSDHPKRRYGMAFDGRHARYHAWSVGEVLRDSSSWSPREGATMCAETGIGLYQVKPIPTMSLKLQTSQDAADRVLARTRMPSV